MTSLPITSLYAAVLALLLVVLSLRVVQQRLGNQVSLGAGGHDDLLVAQRQQGNFVEYVPLALVLLALLEFGGVSTWIVHALGATLVAARLLHPFGVAAAFELRFPRFVGAGATWGVLVVSSVLLLARM